MEITNKEKEIEGSKVRRNKKGISLLIQNDTSRHRDIIFKKIRTADEIGLTREERDQEARFFASCAYLHRIFIRNVVASVYDPDAFAPIQTKRRTQDVNGSVTFVPFDRWFCLDGAMRGTGLESRAPDEFPRLIHHLGTTFHGGLAIMERKKCSFILDPCAVLAEL